MTTTGPIIGIRKHREARLEVIAVVAEEGFGPIESNDPEQLRTDLDSLQSLVSLLCAEVAALRVDVDCALRALDFE